MIELRAICREAATLRGRGVPFLLATVVRVSGSAYRRAGARMLIAEDRWIAGSVSGGCLERDVLVRGAFRTRRGSPVLVTYDATSEDDDVRWGLGVGCNGTVDVLLERIDERTALDPIRFAGLCIASEQPGALVTVFAPGDSAVALGARVAVRDEGIVAATIQEGPLRDTLTDCARCALADRDWRAQVHVVDGVTALVERFSPPPHLVVIGTRHDALPLVTLAVAMNLGVTVADTGVDASTRERFAVADQLVFGSPLEIARAIDDHPSAAVVVMTHDYERDRACLAAALRTRARYVGVLGPRARTARMLEEAGTARTDDVVGRLHAPVGLDLGAETPHEIALSILAEIHAVFGGATACPLREKPGAIHADREPRVERRLG